jgi:hypothetical protein
MLAWQGPEFKPQRRRRRRERERIKMEERWFKMSRRSS